jgi:type IV secretory pathway TraG/TraD family ATPase VirD4
MLSGHSDLGSVLSYIEGDNAQSQGVLSERFSVMREILIGVFAQKGNFSIRDFVRKKGNKTLFIEYDLSIGSILTPVYRLMFDLALKEALGRSKPQGNVYLICDEFKLLPHLQHIDDGVNFGRSLGVKVMAGIQSIEQLFEIYGKSRGMNIAAGFSSLFAFRANDTSTREYISGFFGKNIILEQYQMSDNKIVEEKRNGSTVEDWDLNSLQIGEAIVGLPFALPFRFCFDLF